MAASSEIAVVVRTLRFLAEGWVFGEENRKWLVSTADTIESDDPEGWICCPLCAETVCDEGCPLERVRAAVEDW